MDPSLGPVSKFLSWVLRHRPDAIGLQLDAEGWADVEALLVAARGSGMNLDRQLLLLVVSENDKQRFALNDDGTKIRAVQGHSVSVDLGLEPIRPPHVLYHGTVGRFFNGIVRNGLQAGSRQYVHLSPDLETATNVARRRGKPIVLEVLSGSMYLEGFTFYRSENGVWLTEHVPLDFLRFPGT